ncbi:DNA helicase [Paramuricea clavata]|uniref:ATP-dependent DNA helicase n=1 Tax=Paramuricea clavata TaxID=317549 RepID=A0A6S7JXI0_PARCT|nr:DNA helicase [Paramuricea clavata]
MLIPVQRFDDQPLQEAILPTGYNYHVEDHNPHAVLKNVFGFLHFRPGQEEAISAVLNKKDAIVVIPTDGGKTIVYSIPTLLIPGITVVVSPLLMLMHDQLLKLREKGINTCYVNSMLTSKHCKSVIANLSRPDSEYKVLLVSPEVLLSPSLDSLMKKLKVEGRLNFFAIDKAHCIDTWGVDIRPDYQELGKLKKYGVPIVALTGTATTVTIEQITGTLRLSDPKHVKLPFTRENLVFEVYEKKPGPSAAMKQVADLITSRFSGQCGIVYCSHREETARLALELKNNNISTIYFHGGIMDPEVNLRHASLWLDGKVDVICANNSFGMGIDKQDVRFVIHLSHPSSYEAYVQESGRAGRDGSDARCIVLHRFEDRKFHLSNISKTVSAEARAKRLSSLNDFSSYLLERHHCYQKLIADYFDSTLEEPCGKCGNCQNPAVPITRDNTVHGKQLVACLQHMQIINDKVSVDELA